MTEPVVPFKDAFVAISSVSAVLWTGGLIVLQLRHENRTDPKNRALYVQQSDWIKGAMACIAFGMLAPLFALFVSGVALQLIASFSFALYYVLTWRNIAMIIRAARHPTEPGNNVVASIAFFLPTIAMLVVAAIPLATTILWSAAILDFAGYFVVSSMVNRLARSD